MAGSKLCPRCLGRRLIGATGIENQTAAAADHDTVDEPDCPVCEGRFGDLDTWVELAVKAAEGRGAASFQVGTSFPTECEEAEKEWKHLNPDVGDTIRTEANRLLAPRIAEATGMQLVTDARPDIVLHVDTRFWTAEASANSVYIEGRYTKHRRDVPQTHWPCKMCQGLGCYQCDDTGVQYAESVEEAIAKHADAAFGASSSSFHGAGREDIDALMLGTGRPFVFELKDPQVREVDLGALEAAINAESEVSGVGVTGLIMSTKDRVQYWKDGTYDKEYLAHCETDADVSQEQVEAAAEAMTGVMLEQRTPQRVSHRRADLVRKRMVHNMTLEEYTDARHFTVRVHADSGAYIKEMISSDEGRTTPSLAATLGVGCVVDKLDVTAILDEPHP